MLVTCLKVFPKGDEQTNTFEPFMQADVVFPKDAVTSQLLVNGNKYSRIDVVLTLLDFLNQTDISRASKTQGADVFSLQSSVVVGNPVALRKGVIITVISPKVQS